MSQRSRSRNAASSQSRRAGPRAHRGAGVPREEMFQHANYFLNFQKLLGIAKGVKVPCPPKRVSRLHPQRAHPACARCHAPLVKLEHASDQISFAAPVQVDNQTSQRQIIEMYKLGESTRICSQPPASTRAQAAQHMDP